MGAAVGWALMDPTPLAQMLAQYGGWGVAAVLMGAVAWLVKTLMASQEKRIEMADKIAPLAKQLADLVEAILPKRRSR